MSRWPVLRMPFAPLRRYDGTREWVKKASVCSNTWEEAMRSWKESKRRRLRRRAFPSEWLAIVEQNLPIWRRLPSQDKEELLGHIQVLLREKHFEGAAGLVMTDEIRVTIAAHASLLLLRRAADYYPRLISIIVYPHAYVASHFEHDEFGIVTEGEEARLGESWQQGVLVLSWDDVRAAAAGKDDCHNVVLHEFAHQLDSEDGTVEGSPALGALSQYATWARIMSEEYERLQEAAASGRDTLLDEYGATSPAEFFAVTTECFFSRPDLLVAKHPQLYEELKTYYRQDPVQLPRAS